MLKSIRLNHPFDALIPSLIGFYQRQIELHQKVIDISSQFVAGPKAGVDYLLAPKVPEIRAELDDARKAVFDAAALVFMTLIDQKPDSQGHVSHLLISKARKRTCKISWTSCSKMNLTRGITTTTSVPRWCSQVVCKRGASAPMSLGIKRELPVQHIRSFWGTGGGS